LNFTESKPILEMEGVVIENDIKTENIIDAFVVLQAFSNNGLSYKKKIYEETATAYWGLLTTRRDMLTSNSKFTTALMTRTTEEDYDDDYESDELLS